MSGVLIVPRDTGRLTRRCSRPRYRVAFRGGFRVCGISSQEWYHYESRVAAELQTVSLYQNSQWGGKVFNQLRIIKVLGLLFISIVFTVTMLEHGLAQDIDAQSNTELSAKSTLLDLKEFHTPVITTGHTIQPSLIVTVNNNVLIETSTYHTHYLEPIISYNTKKVVSIYTSSLKSGVKSGVVAPISQVVNVAINKSILSTNALTPTGTSYRAFDDSGMDPSDAHIAVGPINLVVVINSRMAVYNKQNPGTLLYETSLNDWYQDLLSADTLIVDPRAIYDHVNERFIVVATALNMTTQEAWWTIAASQSASAIGTWRLHISDSTLDGSTDTENFADFPGVGTNGSHLYLTGNMADFAGMSFQYAKIRIFELNEIYDGNITKYVDILNLLNDDGSNASAIQPAHRYTADDIMYLLNAGSSGNLTLWTVSTPFSDTAAITATNVSVPGFDNPPDAEQPDTDTRIETNDTRLLQALMRDDGIWTAQTVAMDWGTGDRAAIQLYEIKADGTGLLNQVTFGNSTYYFYYPSLAIDGFGNMLIHFSLSSPTLYASIGYTGRRFNDPPNTVESTVRIAKTGVESFIIAGGQQRWGDYSGVAIDPANDQVFWMHNQYAETGNEWNTWIAAATYFNHKVFLPLLLREE